MMLKTLIDVLQAALADNPNMDCRVAIPAGKQMPTEMLDTSEFGLVGTYQLAFIQPVAKADHEQFYILVAEGQQ